jgi:hypothetical protein
VDIPKDEWFHLRLEVVGAQAKLYLKDMDKPALVMDDLKSGVQKGQVALYDLTGATYFSNFEVRTTPDAPWERHLPPMPPGTLTKWSLSPAYDALAWNLERPLAPSERDAIKWQDVEAEPPGFVVLYRYREAPHPRVTSQGDFSKRLEPQPGMKVVYARTTIDSDRDQVKKLEIGYSDDVSVFLNGKILYRGRSAQGFRDPGFLGIVNPENDTVYLPLKKGSNELMLAISELGGGWGFVCRVGRWKTEHPQVTAARFSEFHPRDERAHPRTPALCRYQIPLTHRCHRHPLPWQPCLTAKEQASLACSVAGGETGWRETGSSRPCGGSSNRCGNSCGI